MLIKVISEKSSPSKFLSEDGKHEKVDFPYISQYNISISTPTTEKKNPEHQNPSYNTGESYSESMRYKMFHISDYRRRLRTRAHYFMILLCFYFNAPVAWQYLTSIQTFGGGIFLIFYLILFILINVPILLMKSFISQFSNRSFTNNMNYCRGFRGVGVCYLFYTVLNMMSINLFQTWNIYALMLSCYRGKAWSFINVTIINNIPKVDIFVENMFNNRMINNYTNNDGALTIHPIKYGLFILYIFINCLPLLVAGFGINFNLKLYGFVLFNWYMYVVVLFLVVLTLPYSFYGYKQYFRFDIDLMKQPEFWYTLVRLVSSNTYSVHGLIGVLSSFNEFRHDFRKNLLKLLSISLVMLFFFTYSFNQLVAETMRLSNVKLNVLTDKMTSIQVLYNGFIFALSRLMVRTCWMQLYLLGMFMVNFSSALTCYLILNVAILDLFPRLRLHKRRLLIVNIMITCVVSTCSFMFFIKSGYYYVIVLDRVLFGAGPALLYVLEWGSLIIYSFNYVVNDYGMIFKVSHPILMKVYSIFVIPVLLVLQFLILCVPIHPYKLYYAIKPKDFSLDYMHYSSLGVIVCVILLFPCMDYYKYRIKQKLSINSVLDCIFSESITWGPGKEVFWNVKKYQTKLYHIDPRFGKRGHRIRNVVHYTDLYTEESNLE